MIKITPKYEHFGKCDFLTTIRGILKLLSQNNDSIRESNLDAFRQK